MTEYKYWSWICVGLCVLLHIFGFYWLFMLCIGIVFCLLGSIAVVYLNHINENQFLASHSNVNPLQTAKELGLNLDFDKKPIILLSPDVRIQTESKKRRSLSQTDTRKKSLIDSGIELFGFKKSNKSVKEAGASSHPLSNDYKISTETLQTINDGDVLAQRSNSTDEPSLWKLFDSIKIHTDKRRSVDANDGAQVLLGEECSSSAQYASDLMPTYKLHTDSALLDQYGSPKKKFRAMLSGNKQIDQLLHIIINYILRDFINSWFFSLSDNKEFSEYRTRNCIEESLQNVCTRIRNTQWVPLMTTKAIDIVALHSRLYRKANDTVNLQLDETKKPTANNGNGQNATASPQRKNVPISRSGSQHRRNKSDTDVNWYSGQRNVANSKFYESIEVPRKSVDKSPDAAETKLINAFFNQNELFRDECLDDEKLEQYLTKCMETVLYFTLPEEDFACIPLRTFLSTLLANVACKPIIDLLSDPDFINLQVAKMITKEPPSSEIFLRLLRQCDDLSELRACRQLITREMDSKFQVVTTAAELDSLKYVQKLIDSRINFLQDDKLEYDTDHKTTANLPILSLDEILNKELSLSYYLDYLSILNLQYYVIFYLTARDWKAIVNRCSAELQSTKQKVERDETIKLLREKAKNIYMEFLSPSSSNTLNIDSGLIETLNIRLTDTSIVPDSLWFESICKYVYEKIKNEAIFLANFYKSSSYRKLLMELEWNGTLSMDGDIESTHSFNQQSDTASSDSHSGDMIFDDEIDFIALDGNGSDLQKIPTKHEKGIGAAVDLGFEPIGMSNKVSPQKHSLDVVPSGGLKHYRSHSDSGLVQISSIRITPDDDEKMSESHDQTESNKGKCNAENVPPNTGESQAENNIAIICPQQRLSAKIVNTAINCDGQYAVYAIHVTIIEDNQQKSWHVYRRYSRFLDLKKLLVKRFPSIAQIPFPAKKTFHNTQRSVLEHRMTMLNEFLKTISIRADDNDELYAILRDFLEPDTNDKKIHGGAVIRTIETIVNPLKSGMRTIKNMPDTLVGGLAKILLGKGPTKETAFLDVSPIHLEHSSEYPALTSALNLLDEVFDLQARSQWLRRGLINRLLGAPWVSQAANRRIIQAAKNVIEVDRIENLIGVIINTIWPDGKRSNGGITRDESTKLRTQMAAKVALFTLLADELKHVVGSETTRYGLLNCFSMWQHRTLNKRLVLVLFNEILTSIYKTDDLTKHTK